MGKEQIKTVLSNIIEKFLSKQIDVDEVQSCLVEEVDPDEIYEIEDNMLVTDCYFALKHLKETGYETSNAEIRYFLECLSGAREYSLEEKNRIILKNAEK
ncbi:MAG: hypothetical protein VR67_03505 [Peptococcaceae bacterium BRH_c8a]|nr:MAG: hypothetical protein VR67_03505 [Peptococcaceae bacterium BRH_c8a]